MLHDCGLWFAWVMFSEDFQYLTQYVLKYLYFSFLQKDFLLLQKDRPPPPHTHMPRFILILSDRFNFSDSPRVVR